MASPLASIYGASLGASAMPTPFRAQVAPTDVEKAYSDYNNAMMQAYAAQVGQQNAMFGGLAGLGSAGVTMLPKLLAGAAPAAAGSSALLGGSADAIGDAAALLAL